MGVALFVVPESVLQADAFINGKALAAAIDSLEALSEELGVVPLEDFMDHTEALGLLEDLEDDGEGFAEDDFAAEERLVSEDRDWFDPGEGLKTVTALLEAVQHHPLQMQAGFSHQDVVQDLQDLQRVLQACQDEGVRFHLALDI